MVDFKKQQRGQRILRAIQQSGLPQRRIAERIGVTPQSITKWIRTGNIYVDNLLALAEITGVELRYLLTGESTPAINETAKKYNTARSELHDSIDQLDEKSTRLLKLCLNAIMESEDNLGIRIEIGKRRSEP